MKAFKFFRKAFNVEDYDVPPEFRFLGVTPLFRRNNGSLARKMIYVYTDGTIVEGHIIFSDHDAYHLADVYEVRGNQVFLLPRQEAEYINVTLTFTPNNEL